MSSTLHCAWTPSLGAWVVPEGTAFRVWAPLQQLRRRDRGASPGTPSVHPLVRSLDGIFSAVLPDLRIGDRYRYHLDNDRPLPDPVSRFQPEGVHGPSQVVDPRSFHWGYDGVAPFAPARCYGTPHDLRRLVDTAHGLGLGVFLDVAYNRDYGGRTEDLAVTIRREWFYIGQFSTHVGERRGTDPTGIPANRFVIGLQNHHQIGNRAPGERLHDQIDLAAYRAASVLLLMAPETPLLFMGQEWAISTPFLYFTDHFTDHHAELGRLMTAGRREAFRHFAAFSDPGTREQIPDSQARSTFLSSRLICDERIDEPHSSTLRPYQALLILRHREPALHRTSTFQVAALDEATIAIRRDGSHDTLLVVARLKGAGVVDPMHGRLGACPSDEHARLGRWQQVLTSEDPAFSPAPSPRKPITRRRRRLFGLSSHQRSS